MTPSLFAALAPSGSDAWDPAEVEECAEAHAAHVLAVARERARARAFSEFGGRWNRYHNPRPLIVKGDRFGRLTALDDEPPGGDGRKSVPCACDCGKAVRGHVYNMVSGKSLSCGCRSYDSNGGKQKHGRPRGDESNRRLANNLNAMKARCYNPKHPAYAGYGAKGITVCGEWLDSLDAFRKWAYANGYERGKELHRKDPAKGYSPENCEYLTPEEHVRRSSANVWVSLFGETRNLTAWLADPRCVNVCTYRRRLAAGMDPAAALVKTTAHPRRIAA